MAATLASYVRELLIKTPSSLLQRRCWTNWMALGVYIQARTIPPTRYRNTVHHGLLVKRRDWLVRLARSMGRISPWGFSSQSYVKRETTARYRLGAGRRSYAQRARTASQGLRRRPRVRLGAPAQRAHLSSAIWSLSSSLSSSTSCWWRLSSYTARVAGSERVTLPPGPEGCRPLWHGAYPGTRQSRRSETTSKR